MCLDGTASQCDQSTHTAPHSPEPTRWQLVSVCWTLTPLCEGHPEVLRWLVEGPELGVSPFPCILMGSVGELSVVCSVRFKVLCRSTKAGPSAPLVSPPSSLKSWTGPPSRQKTWWMKPSRSRRDETWWVWIETGSKSGRTKLETFGQDVIWDRWPTWTSGQEEEICGQGWELSGLYGLERDGGRIKGRKVKANN